ncbi:putative nucleotidyltransferase, ribonuclease H [Tanacetum coccineum]
MLLRIVTMWVPLPKDILGASSQRPTGCLFPKIYWVPLPKDILGASSQRYTGSCGVKEFFRTKGSVGILSLLECMEYVLHIIKCPAEIQVEFATCMLQGQAPTWLNNLVQARGRAAAMALPWEDLKNTARSERHDKYFSSNDHFVTVLFDSGADFSFVSTEFLLLINVKPSAINLKVHGERPEWNLKQLKTIKVDEKKLKDILVICNFPSVFPEDLSGLPPSRELEFHIDLIPGAMHVAKSLYCLGAPVLFVKKKDGSFRICIDLRSGYHQLRVREEDIPKTAFMIRYIHFEFTVRPFSLTNAPVSKGEHEVHLKLILELLEKEKLFGKFLKYGLLQTSQILQNLSPSKIEVVKNWKPLKTPVEIRSFLILAGYYRRFIANFSKISKPLTLLTLKDKKFEWGDDRENAFQTLKDMLCDTSILALPKGPDDFVVYCDASKLRFWLCVDAEKQGVVVFALKMWRHYLYGTKSVIYTDHKILQHIFDQKDLNILQKRWVELFNDYDCEIHYHPGKANILADALSRKEWMKPRRVRDMSLTIYSRIKARILEAQSEASRDVNSPAEMLRGLKKQFERKDNGGLYFVERIWVPMFGNLRTLIMDEANATNYFVHPRADKMYYDLRDLYWWPRIKKDIALYVRKCLTCSKVKAKHQKPPGLLQKLEIPEWK